MVALGIVSLIAFALALTRVGSAFAPSHYAAYGGIYIAASLVWLWPVEGQSPTPTHLVGARSQSVERSSSSGFAARVRQQRPVACPCCCFDFA